MLLCIFRVQINTKKKLLLTHSIPFFSLQFKIQFDDSLTATYEYPSESSLVIDETFGDCDDEVDANFYGRSSTSKLLTSVPLGE